MAKRAKPSLHPTEADPHRRLLLKTFAPAPQAARLAHGFDQQSAGNDGNQYK
jgi:hypothetical protein